MTDLAPSQPVEARYPVQVHVEQATDHRDRLTAAFRFVLAIPHLLLVGGPLAATLWWTWNSTVGLQLQHGAGGGVFGALAGVAAFIAWFAILFTGRFPEGLWTLIAFYLRWRVRAVAYMTLLRDEYPPFGDGPYPATLELAPPAIERNRLTAAFRIILAIPHLILLWILGMAWACTTVIAWFAIVLTGRYPVGLYHFGVGVFQWSIRVEAYVFLLCDEYPPFLLRDPPLQG